MPQTTAQTTAQPAPLDAFQIALAQALAAAATTGSDRTWQPEPSSPEQPEATPAPTLHLLLTLAGALTGSLTLGLTETDATLLFPNAAPADLPGAWQQIGPAVAEHLERAITQTLGQSTVTVAADPSAQSPGKPVTRLVLRANDEFTAVSILCSADATLANTLHLQPRTSAPPSPIHRVTPMDRVVDVPLAVTIRFGQRTLLLRELLELTTGSLLELDRQVEEPVDLMLGERVIARGEVVIVDGNYGMRVTEVLENASRPAASRDRLQTLSYASA